MLGGPLPLALRPAAFPGSPHVSLQLTNHSTENAVCCALQGPAVWGCTTASSPLTPSPTTVAACSAAPAWSPSTPCATPPTAPTRWIWSALPPQLSAGGNASSSEGPPGPPWCHHSHEGPPDQSMSSVAVDSKCLAVPVTGSVMP